MKSGAILSLKHPKELRNRPDFGRLYHRAEFFLYYYEQLLFAVDIIDYVMRDKLKAEAPQIAATQGAEQAPTSKFEVEPAKITVAVLSTMSSLAECKSVLLGRMAEVTKITGSMLLQREADVKRGLEATHGLKHIMRKRYGIVRHIMLDMPVPSLPTTLERRPVTKEGR